MTTLICRSCGGVHKAPFRPGREDYECGCGGSRALPSELRPRQPMHRVSEKHQGGVRRRGSTLKRGKGFAASKAQQDKIRGLPCAVCGQDGYEAQIDAAHVYPRRFASCECAEGVIGLCRTCHRLYDEGKLDLLPALISRGYRAELVHAVVAHEAPLVHLLEQVTSCGWKPSPKREEAATAAPERSQP